MPETKRPTGTTEERLTRIEEMLIDLYGVNRHEIESAKAQRREAEQQEQERAAAVAKFEGEKPRREKLLREFIKTHCDRGLNHNALRHSFAKVFDAWRATQRDPVEVNLSDGRIFREALEVAGCASDKVVNDYSSPVDGFLGLSLKPQFRDLDDTRNPADDFRAAEILRARRQGKPIPEFAAVGD